MTIKVLRNFRLIISLFVILSTPLGLTTAGEFDKTENQIPSVFFAGTWKTQSGSTYEWKNNEMICISVNDDKFKGWINNVALRNFRQEGERWYADQAIRYHYTGKLSEWATAEIEIRNKDSFTKTVQKTKVEKSSCCEPQLWRRIKQ